jgi:hypothetical protein
LFLWKPGEMALKSSFSRVSKPWIAYSTVSIRSRRKKMAMSRPASINVFSVALVSGALHGGAAMLFVPIFSFLLLCWSNAPAQIIPSTSVDKGMVLAVIAPVLCAAFGFVVGALGALAHNALAQNQRRHTVDVSEPDQVRTASLSNVA